MKKLILVLLFLGMYNIQAGGFLKLPLKKEEAKEEVSQTGPCHIDRVPRDVSQIVAFNAFINELKARHEAKQNFYLSKGTLYQKRTDQSSFSKISGDTKVWQYTDTRGLAVRWVTPPSTSDFSLIGWKSPELVKLFMQTIPNIKAPGSNGHQIIIDYGNGNQEVVKDTQLPTYSDGQISRASLSRDKKLLLTLEEKSKYIGFDDDAKRPIISSKFNVVIRERQSNGSDWVVKKTFSDIASENQFVDMMYFEGFNCVGLLKKDGQTVKLVSLGEERIDQSQPSLNDFFYKKAVRMNPAKRKSLNPVVETQSRIEDLD